MGANMYFCLKRVQESLLLRLWNNPNLNFFTYMVFPSLQFSLSNSWVGGSSSSLASATTLEHKKLGWFVDERSLAHILSVMTTLFCFSVTRCTKNLVSYIRKRKGNIMMSKVYQVKNERLEQAMHEVLVKFRRSCRVHKQRTNTKKIEPQGFSVSLL